MPLSALLFLTSLITAAAIVIPVAVLAFQGANETVDDILLVVRDNYAGQLVSLVSSTLGVVYAATHRNAEDFAIVSTLQAYAGQSIDFITHNSLDVTDQLPIRKTKRIYAYSQAVNQYDFLMAMGVSAGDGRDAVFVSHLNGPGSYYHNVPPNSPGLQLVVTGYDLATRTATFIPPVNSSFPNAGVVVTNPAGQWASQPVWAPLTFMPDGTPIFAGLYGLNQPQWSGVAFGTPGPNRAPDYIQQTVANLQRYSDLLSELKTTPNTVIAIWDANGLLVASNADQSVLFNPAAHPPVSWSAESAPTQTIAIPAQKVLAKYGSYAKIPDATSNTFSTANGDLFVDTRRINDATNINWTVMLAIPQSDLLGPLKASRNKVIGVSVGIAVAMLAFAAFSSYFVTRPLRELTRIMVQASNMDFSALQQGYLKQTQFVRELGKMQAVFGGMLQRFARAIEDNRRLATHGKGSQPSGFTSPRKLSIIKTTAVDVGSNDGLKTSLSPMSEAERE
ncbi:uncharacterized protein EV422DRAFT_607366 [Fimicolochytrium jonesii]|uniref:uncharacterized protein n=1 Tax=Fimicolochytrium jonesii TaxID=1396493 RepID=UPI0022FE532E|nr:uncharacterized protein EV422DRAFT_607366 [Fimicolochytrium jonesii]KAI8816848.1 hypothetical protein EV422DRAFT_607366 [Fimicolochytrium jonesii]